MLGVAGGAAGGDGRGGLSGRERHPAANSSSTKNPSRGVEPVAHALLRDGQHLVGRREPEAAGEQADVVLVLSDPVRQHLEGEEHLR